MQWVEKQKISQVLSTVTPEKTFIIVSTTAYAKLDRKSQQMIKKAKCPVLYSNSINAKEFYASILYQITKYPKLNQVISIGGGTVIDYAKYLAKHKNLRCTVIPSMLSTNAFATNKIAVISQFSKHTEDGVLPHVVVLDETYLNKSPRENLYGLADVFSIYNALRDWKIAQKYNGELIDESIWMRAMTCLKQSITLLWGYNLNKRLNLQKVYEVIRESGYITNDYGSGRPESGSEHIFASALESQVSIPHALAVTLGIHIMEYFSRNVDVNPVYDFTKLPFSVLVNQVNEQQLSRELVAHTVQTLQPRVDKYTLVNQIQPILGTQINNLFNFLKDCGFTFK